MNHATRRRTTVHILAIERRALAASNLYSLARILTAGRLRYRERRSPILIGLDSLEHRESFETMRSSGVIVNWKWENWPADRPVLQSRPAGGRRYC